MKTEIYVVYSSHLSFEVDVKFDQHIRDTIGAKHRIFRTANENQFSLSTVYNTAMNSIYGDENAIYVFCHNDITFKTPNWGRRLLAHFNHSEYGILGIAGTTFIPEGGRWWDDRSKMYGIVEHTDGTNTWVNIQTRFTIFNQQLW